MGKLRSLGAAVRAVRPKAAERSTEVMRRSIGWYNTARWRRLRHAVLLRDGFVCRQTGVVLNGKYPAKNSPVVDHIRPHRGDPDLFWDIDNLQAVAKGWHDREKQSLEKRGRVG